MKKAERLSAGQAAAVLEQAPFSAVVCGDRLGEDGKTCLLYANELSKKLFLTDEKRPADGTYEDMGFGQLPFADMDEEKRHSKAWERECKNSKNGRIYRLSGKWIDWEDGPAYMEYAVDITEDVEEMENRKEKERLEQYFQTVVKYLPGGVAVVHYEKDGSMTPEFLSDGFAAMTGMTMEEAWELYKEDAMAGVHPDDREKVNRQMAEYIASGKSQCEIVYRLKRGDGTYFWVKNTLSLIQNEGGEKRVYAGYHDMTKEREEQERLRRQYNELIVQHYRMPEPNALVVGHCNVTQSRILDVIDYTDSDLLKVFGSDREQFFTGLSSLVVEEDMRRKFRGTYLNKPSLEAFKRGDLEQKLICFAKFPRDDHGRYVQFKMNLVATPDSNDITGILTVTDVTEKVVSDKILHSLSVSSYDLVMDINLNKNFYTILSIQDRDEQGMPQPSGLFAEQIDYLINEKIVPRDRKNAARFLERKYMLERLEKDGAYSFSYSVTGKNGEVLTKNLTITAIDLRIGRICIARTDITESVREQQGVLRVVANTFELMGLINLQRGSITMHTRQTILENLPPYFVKDYSNSVKFLADFYNRGGDSQEAERQFRLSTMLERLQEKPEGYDFVLPYGHKDNLRYKQVTILWGDKTHQSVCMVRADVTDMLTEERRAKAALEEALAVAEEANRAKSDFLSSMSHDIRTPMNAIIGMTTLAMAHLDDKKRIEDYLGKISYSSQHLLSLINDILDMSKIERSKITLNQMKMCIPQLLEQLYAIMAPQARAAGLKLTVQSEKIVHKCVCGDSLRVNQIMINILGNAIKFTPEGGTVEIHVEEIPPVKKEKGVRYLFTVKDNGIGMTEEFQKHIFDPFFRKSSHVEGTGLGLSITKGLVDLMNGSISVVSRQHVGSTFYVELEFDCAEMMDEKKEQKPSEPFEGEREKILEGCNFLIAEDNAINSEILCEILQMYGARSVVKTDGAQTVEEFQKTDPGTYDAILMDIQMPLMNGYDATRVIRKLSRPDAQTIPIIAMTANAFAEDIQAAEDAGMTAHVAKPIDMKILLATLKGALTTDEKSNKIKNGYEA